MVTGPLLESQDLGRQPVTSTLIRGVGVVSQRAIRIKDNLDSLLEI